MNLSTNAESLATSLSNWSADRVTFAGVGSVCGVSTGVSTTTGVSSTLSVEGFSVISLDILEQLHSAFSELFSLGKSSTGLSESGTLGSSDCLHESIQP